jgi:hypothetical protein
MRFVSDRSSSSEYGSLSGVAMGLLSARRLLTVNRSAARRDSAHAPLASAQCVESTARLLRGACAEVGSKRTGKPTFGRALFAGDTRLRRLRVQRDCIARRASPLGHLGYDQRAPVCPDGHVDRVPRPNGFRGFDALAVHVHPPPEDGLGRRAPRLEHARCPEPLVDPHLLHNAMIARSRATRRSGRPSSKPARD